jgi:chemotaxis protein CheY-P-specific phosphatase CheC
MNILNSIQLDVTKELISMALANAADSFSKMTHEQVLISGYKMKVIEPGDVETLLVDSAENTDYFMLNTQIKGQISAQTYLMINHKDTGSILNIFAPGQPAPALDQLTELQEATLLELDNIITAAMVTQISNILEVFAYGDVPSLQHLPQPEIIDHFREDIKSFDVILLINARFRSDLTNMNPHFICFFKTDFLASVIRLVNEKKHLCLIKNTF